LAVSHSSRERKTGKCYGICEVPRREIQIRKGRANTRFVLPFLEKEEDIDIKNKVGFKLEILVSKSKFLFQTQFFCFKALFCR
jgi:hypothetical protein